MKVKELVAILTALDQEKEIRGVECDCVEGEQWTTTRIEVAMCAEIKGRIPCDANKCSDFYLIQGT